MNAEQLVQTLQSGNEVQKVNAALVIHSRPELACDSSIEILKALLKHRSWHIRRAAALALIKCLSETARPLVLHLLTDKAYGVREDVRTALSELGTTKAAKTPQGSHWKKRVRKK